MSNEYHGKLRLRRKYISAMPPHTLGEKKLYGRVQQVFIKQNTKFWCGTMNPKVLSGVWILLMCVLCWWNEACFNDHTTQQCCAPICCQHFGGLLLYYYVLLSHCCFVRRHTHTDTHVCDVSEGERCSVAFLSAFEKRSKCNVFDQMFRYWKVLLTCGRRKCIYIFECTFNPR